MAQDISTLSPPSVVEAFVRSYLYVDADGSKRVNDTAFLTWLSEQFGYLNGPTSSATPTSKDGDAFWLIRNLQNVVGREHWLSDPTYPNQGVSDSESVKKRLIEVRDKLNNEPHVLEQPYIDFTAGLNARAKSLFTDVLDPGFPAGTVLLTTSRVYVETFVTDRGEESMPSAPSSIVDLDQNDGATVTGNAAPTGRNITLRRLYRSTTGTQSAAFRLQGEYPAAQTVMVDTKPDELLADVCPTFGWLEPLAGLTNLTGLPNGMMLGSIGRTLYACEPYEPYAWPAKYDKPLQHVIVGIVAVGQSAFIGTTGRPYFVSGSDAASLSEELISSLVPCLSAKSMVAIQNSVFYASPDGLALYENGKVVVITRHVIDRKAWRLYNPASMRACEFDGMYMAFFTRADATQGCLLFDYENKSFTEFDQVADAVFANDAGIYALVGTTIYDVVPASGASRLGKWFSKTFRLPKPDHFAWIMVDSTFLNNGTPVSATVRVYADGALHHTATVSSRSPVRSKPGRHSDWRVEVECAAAIDGCVLASTTDELKAVI